MDIRAPTSPENLYFEPLGVERPSTSRDSNPIMSSRAVVDNAKVFPLFAKRLASHDVKEYTATARKMKNWLGSEKAYYPDALRNIVSLLEIAHSTFTTQFMKTASSALAVVDIYNTLINSVVPFLHYFREGDLQLRLKHLIKSCLEILSDFAPPVPAGREATLQECKNALSVITPDSDVTPNTQVKCTSAQVQSPVTIQASSTSTHTTDLPPSVAPSITSISKPQPKRLPKGPSLSEHLKNRDLEWFKMHQQPAGLVMEKSPQPTVLESIHDAAGLLTAEKLRPSRMPARILLQPPCSGTPTSTEVTAPVDIIGQSCTSHSTDARVDPYFKESKNITPAVIDAAVSDSTPEDVHHDSAAPPSLVEEPSVPSILTTTPLPKPRTESPMPISPPPISSGDMGVECHEGDSLPSREADAPSQITYPRFGGDMAVMIFRQGLQSHCGILNINFDLDDMRYSQIAQWAMRKSSPTNVEQSVCVSFACYHLPSLLSIPLEDGELPPFETLTMHASCSWPTTGDLSLQTTRDGKNFVIPLAPPIFVTPDNCVDISSFIRKGENALSVVQQSDMSEYIFILHAHHPTSAQLRYLASCRHKREEWAKTIRIHYKPEPTESLWRRSPLRS